MGEMNKSVFGIIDSSQTVSSEQGTHLTTSYWCRFISWLSTGELKIENEGSSREESQ